MPAALNTQIFYSGIYNNGIMAFIELIIWLMQGFWTLFKTWIHTFTVSFTHGGTIWIILPIWITWFFAEIFQEKKGTSIGNAISNGIVPFWVGIDWLRQLTEQVQEKQIVLDGLTYGKYFLAILAFAYGFIIVVYGIKGRNFVKFAGRIREVTYVLAMFTPVVYGIVHPDSQYWLAMLLFFPLFYLILEIVNKITPEPKSIEQEFGDFGTKNDAFKDMPQSFSEPSLSSLSTPMKNNGATGLYRK